MHELLQVDLQVPERADDEVYRDATIRLDVAASLSQKPGPQPQAQPSAGGHEVS